MVGPVTYARLILKFLKDPQAPTLPMWTKQTTDTAGCEKMLGRLNCENEMVKEQWDSFCFYP